MLLIESFRSMYCNFVIPGSLLVIFIYITLLQSLVFYKSDPKSVLSSIESRIAFMSNSSHFYSTKMSGFHEVANWNTIRSSSVTYTRVVKDRVNAKFGFNILMNKVVPFDRLPLDSRPTGCQFWHYHPSKLPTVTVIIAMVSETEQLFRRTLYSILLNTPRNLLREILIIVNNKDTASFFQNIENEFSQSSLEFNKDLFYKFADFIPQMPYMFHEGVGELFKFYSISERTTLGDCYNEAAKKASGEVLVFLKSAVELGPNWLPPLLLPIVDRSDTVSIPSFGTVSPKSFKFNSSQVKLTYWNWGLQTQRKTVALDSFQSSEQERVETLPLEMNVLDSTQFAISKAFFTKIGLFNPDFITTGEVNWDLTFRILNCGGRILKIPCSTVFVLRKLLPDPMFEIFDEIYSRNEFQFEPKCITKQLAEHWLPAALLDQFYTYNPILRLPFICRNSFNKFKVLNNCPNKKLATLSQSSSSLQTGAHIDVVVVDTAPNNPPKPNTWIGIIGNTFYAICLDVEIDEDRIRHLVVSYCRERAQLDTFKLDSGGALWWENYCLDGVQLVECVKVDQYLPVWRYTNGNLIYGDKQCLTYQVDSGLSLANCVTSNPSQQWIWIK